MASSNNFFVYITGFPKSGNSWLNYLVTNLLGAESVGIEQIYPIKKNTNKNIKVIKTHCPLDSRIKNWNNYESIVHQDLLKKSNNSVINIPIIRDVRDVICSMASFNNKSIDNTIETICKKTIDSEKTDYEIWIDSYYNNSNIDFNIRYRDLHNDPVTILSNICKITGTSLELEQINDIIFKHNFYKIKDKNRYFFRKGKVGTWREEMSNEQKEKVNYVFKDHLTKYGFEQ